MSMLTPQAVASLRQGLAHFRQEAYFEAHDDWEEVWQDMSGQARLFWQAMIQLAVGGHHWQNGNLKGCRSVWHKALVKCDDLGQTYGTDVPEPLFFLIDLLTECLTAVDEERDPVPILSEFAQTVMSETWFALAQ